MKERISYEKRKEWEGKEGGMKEKRGVWVSRCSDDYNNADNDDNGDGNNDDDDDNDDDDVAMADSPRVHIRTRHAPGLSFPPPEPRRRDNNKEDLKEGSKTWLEGQNVKIRRVLGRDEYKIKQSRWSPAESPKKETSLEELILGKN